MNFIQRIFKRKIFRGNGQRNREPQPLRINGCKTSMTATPDDGELAAQALLESRIYGDKEQRRKSKTAKRDNDQPHDAAYYRNLSEKIKESHAADARMATRYVAYCEQELSSAVSHQPSDISHQPSDIRHQTSDIAELERGLYKFQDCAEREGGELLKRWQKCLALAIMKQYKTSAVGHGPTKDERAPEQTTLPGLSEPLS